MVLLLKAICDRMKEFTELVDLTVDLERNYLLTIDRNRQAVTKLILNQDSHHFFHDVILEQTKSTKSPAIASEERLRNASDYFAQYLDEQEKKLVEEFIPWLEDFYFKIVQRLSLLIYKVSNQAEAGIIFETMNNRGKPITELEKVKNYLLYLAGQIKLEDPHYLAQQVSDTWQFIYESLMAAGLSSRSNEDQLLRVHWFMTYDPLVRNWQRSQSIKNRFDIRQYRTDLSKLLIKVQDYLVGLRATCSAYCDILRPGRYNAFSDFKQDQLLQQKIQHTGERLGRIGSIADLLPLLTAVRLTANGEEMLRVLELCECFAFRVYRLGNRRGNTGQSRLYRTGYEHFKNSDFGQTEYRLRWFVHHYFSDARFEGSFSEDDNYWYGWSGLKYFLYEYEQYKADERGIMVRMPWEELVRKKDTIEHILPQTMDRGGYWQARFSTEEHQHWVHDIGNLTLTYDNSSLSNRPFKSTGNRGGKKEMYATSILLTEQEIAGFEDWTVEAIRQRREEIKQWAEQRWYVEKPPPREKGKKKKRTTYSMAEFEKQAKNNGVGDLFRSLLDTFAEYGIGVRFYRFSFTFTPPGNRQYRLGVIWIHPNRIHLRNKPWMFHRFLDITPEKTDEILGPPDWTDVNEDNFKEYRGRLVKLFETAGLMKTY